MSTTISQQIIESFRDRLDNHPIYGAVTTIEQLRTFMEHHVYSVWDFMSLIKYLQSTVAPAEWPWVPVGDGNVRRFINELVLEEESDEAVASADGEQQFASHFELYCGAMEEIGADSGPVRAFVERVKRDGIEQALAHPSVPAPSRRFSETTFAFIGSGRPHRVAAALALGREHIIPGMFRAFLANIGVTEADAPTFHYYLNRHIHLDEDFHAPLSLRLLNELCATDADRDDAVTTAHEAVEARLVFWDGVHAALDDFADVGERGGLTTAVVANDRHRHLQ